MSYDDLIKYLIVLLALGGVILVQRICKRSPSNRLEKLLLTTPARLMTKKDYDQLERTLDELVKDKENLLNRMGVKYTILQTGREWYYDGSRGASSYKIIYSHNGERKELTASFRNYGLYGQPDFWFDFNISKRISLNMAKCKVLTKLIDIEKRTE